MSQSSCQVWCRTVKGHPVAWGELTFISEEDDQNVLTGHDKAQCL